MVVADLLHELAVGEHVEVEIAVLPEWLLRKLLLTETFRACSALESGSIAGSDRSR